MRKHRLLTGKALVVLLGGCLFQFGFGGCNPMTALLALAAAPTLTNTFSGFLGGGEQTAAGREEP